MPNMKLAYELLLTRLDRGGTTPPESLADYLHRRLEAAAQQLQREGIVLEDTTRDTMLLVDLAAWQHQNRDNPGATPAWLRAEKRNRWIQQREAGAGT